MSVETRLSRNPQMKEMKMPWQRHWIIADRKVRSDLILLNHPQNYRKFVKCHIAKIRSMLQRSPQEKQRCWNSSYISGCRDMKEHDKFFNTVDKLKNMNVQINGDLLTIIFWVSVDQVPYVFDSWSTVTNSSLLALHIQLTCSDRAGGNLTTWLSQHHEQAKLSNINSNLNPYPSKACVLDEM